MSQSRWWLVVLLAVWAGCAVYVGTRLTRGWVPHDEGALGQSADRVAAGQLPHRDYDEIYTGGLAYLDALAFRVFGENLVSPRIALFLVFLLWVPAVFYIASRFLGPWGSGGLTLLAVSWSLPNYAAAMPSWFNLFFATFGAAALLRFAETDRRGWLFTAGLSAGLSCVIKIIGIYFLAGALLAVVGFEQRSAATDRPGGAAPSAYWSRRRSHSSPPSFGRWSTPAPERASWSRSSSPARSSRRTWCGRSGASPAIGCWNGCGG